MTWVWWQTEESGFPHPPKRKTENGKKKTKNREGKKTAGNGVLEETENGASEKVYT
jgi:hypothetical protein